MDKGKTEVFSSLLRVKCCPWGYPDPEDGNRTRCLAFVDKNGREITGEGGRVLHRSRPSDWLIAVLVAVLLAMVIRLNFYAPYRVYGNSMFPTLQGNELLIV